MITAEAIAGGGGVCVVTYVLGTVLNTCTKCFISVISFDPPPVQQRRSPLLESSEGGD